MTTKQHTEDKPEFCKNEHLVYLDDLRDSGITNMFGAAPYLQKEFQELDILQARAILSYYAKTF